MKLLKKFLLILLILFIVSIAGIYFYLKSTAPQYEGALDIEGIESEVKVYFDEFGIPHIYAQNGQDAYRSLGYIHAQERLFQMEMIKRLTTGRLSEFLGPDMLEADKYFRTLGIEQMSESTAEKWLSDRNDPMVQLTEAYLEGINQYIQNGQTPIEFMMLGIEKEAFSKVDIYNVFAYMSLGFTAALKEDPLISVIQRKLGDDYIGLFDFGNIPDSSRLAVSKRGNENQRTSSFEDFSTESILKDLGMPLWFGSNAWVLSPKKSKSGKVLLANDTHIGFSQPSVWYEAHLEYPGFSFYGNYLAGGPFGIIGHNRKICWGITIFPIDNMDLYKEKVNPDNDLQYWVNDRWEDFEIRKEIIHVKGAEDVVFDVKSTRHGPVLNDCVEAINEEYDDPISMWWVVNKTNTQFLQASFKLNYANNMDEAKNAARLVDILGLNVMYGDISGNIAWWGSGWIPKRPAHVNSKEILDGASGENEILGYYDFDENPHVENPDSGYISSCNHEPIATKNGLHVPGYYLPNNRINRLNKFLKADRKWSLEELKSIHRDVINDEYNEMLQVVLKDVKPNKQTMPLFEKLNNWDGNFKKQSSEPVIYSKFIYHIVRLSMEDELGKPLFDNTIKTFVAEKSFPSLLKTIDSPWWDNILTDGKKEIRRHVVNEALDITNEELKAQFGEDMEDWQWGKVHQLTHVHAIGRKKPFDKFFNVGPFEAPGGSGVLNKMDYRLNAEGIYPVPSGPALRILLDFDDLENSISINPTGQSGNVMSPHYDDQAEMFVNGKYRPQLMNKTKIEAEGRLLIIE